VRGQVAGRFGARNGRLAARRLLGRWAGWRGRQQARPHPDGAACRGARPRARLEEEHRSAHLAQDGSVEEIVEGDAGLAV